MSKSSTMRVSVLVIAMTAIAEVAHGDFAFELIGAGFDSPVYATQAAGDDNTLYVVEQQGPIISLDLSTGGRTEFLRVDGNLAGGEGGMHGLAFHPEFATNGRFYVSWIEQPDPASAVVSRLDEYVLRADSGGALHTRLLYRERGFNGEHLINWIGFDPTATGSTRGYLYITLGDNGGQAGNPGYVNVSQDLRTTYGKVLRIDVDPEAPDAYPGNSDRNYAIPPDNPYVSDGNDQTLGEIYHSGLRNPWRASFDRATGDMYIGNVGHSTFEEVEFASAGEAGVDFGWARREGTIETPVPGIGGPLGDSRNPVHQYDHTVGASVIGGYVYRGPVPSLRGSYFFADYTHQRLWRGQFDGETDPASFDGNSLMNVEEVPQVLLTAASRAALGRIASFGEDNAGNLYIVDHGPPFGGGGQIFRIVESLRGDYSGNGIVDQTDLDLLLGNWGKSGASVHGRWLIDRPSDAVDQSELDAVLLSWGETYAARAVRAAAGSIPEPSAFVIVLICIVTLPVKASALGTLATHPLLRRTVMNHRMLLGGVALVAVLGCLCQSGKAEIVYDGLEQHSGGEGAVFGGTHFFANLVELDGISRRVDSLVFNVHARDEPVATSVFGNIHLNDGGGEEPGSLLWESMPLDVLLTTDSSQRVSIDVPFISVPDEIWVVAGVEHDVADPPLRFRENDQGVFTGTNRRSIIRSVNSSDWWDAGPIWAMRVTAVPEPSTLGVLTVLLGAFLFRWNQPRRLRHSRITSHIRTGGASGNSRRSTGSETLYTGTPAAVCPSGEP